jgi:hypothetical protein
MGQGERNRTVDQPISYETVTQTWERMSETPLDQVESLVRSMEAEQPVILAYLLAQDEEVFDQDERETLLYIGMVLWQIMRQGSRRPKRVTEKKLFEAEENNYTFLDQLAGDTDADFLSATLAMLETYPEPEVFRYLIEALMEEEIDPDEEGPIMRDENRGLAFLTLKTALDALIASRQRQKK